MHFNQKLLLFISALVVVIEVKLFLVAGESSNWRGFAYSSAHVFITAVGTYLLLVRSGQTGHSTQVEQRSVS